MTALLNIKTKYWFYLFLFIHTLCWTAAPALFRENLPLDAIEGSIWAHQLQWSYDKNPFLNGWLTALAIYLGQGYAWVIYLFSQLSVAACFWAVWRIAKDMLNPAYALVSVMLLEGLQFYNFHAIDFNDNTLELGTWGLCIYFFYLALQNNKLKPWLLTGLFAGLGLMAKYYTVTLLSAMAIYLFTQASYRKYLRTAAPYAGLALFILIIFPHIVWLFGHDFITVKYVFARGESTASWTNHFYFPLEFAWQQFQVLAPSLVLLGLLFIGKKSNDSVPVLKTENKTFLFFIGLGPFLLTVLLSLILGTKLRAGWGMPLWSLWGIILLALTKPSLTKAKLYRFMLVIYLLLAIAIGIYRHSLVDSKDACTANFPGKQMADAITELWHERYHTPLSYVAGSRWIGGNMTFHSKDHPPVWVEWDRQKAPWISVDDMKKKGAIFVWDISDGESLPPELRKQFPNLQASQVLRFPLLRNTRNLPPAEVGIAMLPPAKAL